MKTNVLEKLPNNKMWHLNKEHKVKFKLNKRHVPCLEKTHKAIKVTGLFNL